MAKLSSDKKSVTVERGDTLSQIASDYANYTGGKSYQQLAAINGIENANLIYIGQVIKFVAPVTPASEMAPATTAIKKHFGLQSDVEDTILATWSWSMSNTLHYELKWEYYTADKIWMAGSETTTTTTYKYATFKIPSNAKKVRLKVRPVSKTYKKGNKEVRYWTASVSSGWEYVVTSVPDTPPVPSVKLEGLKIIAEVTNLTSNPSIIQFEIVKDNSTVVATKKINVSTASATLSYTVTAGSKYKVRCRANKDGVDSAWSNYSNNYDTIPSTPSKITKCEPKSLTNPPSIVLEWSSVSNAKSYEIQYTTNKSYFDTSDSVTSKTGIENTSWEITSDIQTGQTYFFRVRAVNDQGSSGWTEISSTVIGTGPAAPTTWSSTVTVVVGEPLTLYWIHNTEDGSVQSHVEIELYIDGVKQAVPKIDDSNKTDKTSSYEVKMTNDAGSPLYPEGAKILWRVRTAGISNEWSPWSIQREVNVYMQPTVDLVVKNSEGIPLNTELCYKVESYPGAEEIYGTDLVTDRSNRVYIVEQVRNDIGITITGETVHEGIDRDGECIYYCIERTGDTITSYPFTVSASTYPSSQKPIGYHISIISEESYETVDNVGNTKLVTAGDEIYSGHFNPPEDKSLPLEAELSAGDLTLENGVMYKIVCSAAMDSGLTGETSISLGVSFDLIQTVPEADIYIDTDDFSAYITPSCIKREIQYRKVDRQGSVYTVTTEVVNYVYGSRFDTALTTTDEEVYYGVTDTGESIYYCTVENTTVFEGVTLAVYRREFDGSFVEIASGLDGSRSITVIDPYPALDYARYRIVATSKTNGSVTYYDTPSYPVGGTAAVIQWAENWSNIDVDNPEQQTEHPNSTLILPYNIDVSNNHNPDVSLVEYIGRRHPVSYYGTQVGETATWNMDIEKSDRETLYTLRRLAIWPGNAYVREPSGSGYWANVTVSFSQKHRELTIPVTLNITRVEGGV